MSDPQCIRLPPQPPRYPCSEPTIEHTLRWKDLTDEEHEAVLIALRTNNSQPIMDKFDVVMPCFFTIQFPLCYVDPRQPPDAIGQLQTLVNPRAQGQVIKA